jgi:hypothetical protein
MIDETSTRERVDLLLVECQRCKERWYIVGKTMLAAALLRVCCYCGANFSRARDLREEVDSSQ